MSIGTAKPSLEEQKGIDHYFINSHSLQDEVTAARFAKEAETLLTELFKDHEVVILTGGSGMFVDALINGIDDIPTDEELKENLINLVEKNGLEPLLNELKEKDPVFYDRVDKNNPSRIIRAIEAIRLTGIPFSELRTGESKMKQYQVVRFVLEHQREELYQRINHRVDEMINKGLIEEVKSLIAFKEMNALRTVGYKELISYLEGEISLEKAIELIKQHTRNYAKRQLTWLRRYEDAILIEYKNKDQVFDEILDHLNKFNKHSTSKLL
jgi:tRNA dimethylallyltransferase